MDVNSLLIPEPDKSLYYFAFNSNRILNLVGFSGVEEVKLTGCSTEFVEIFRRLTSSHRKAGFRIVEVPRTCFTFGENLCIEPGGSGVIVVEELPGAIPIAYQLARQRSAGLVHIDPLSQEEVASFMEGWRDFEDGNGLARQNGLNVCRAIIERKLRAEFLSKAYTSITFITKVPVNLVVSNRLNAIIRRQLRWERAVVWRPGCCLTST